MRKSDLFYQDTLKEGEIKGERKVKLKSIPKMLSLGMEKEQIAYILDVDLDFINQVIEDNNN